MLQVKIYSSPTCSFCIAAKKFLSENKVKYESYDVSQDRERAEEMFCKSLQSAVPVLEIDGKIIVGYNKQAIKAALGI